MSEGDADVEDNGSKIGRHQCFAVPWPNCVPGDCAGSILRNAVLSQRHSRMLVIDLAQVERIDAAGLGVLLGLRVSARSHAIMFKLMNATKKVEEILELTQLQRVFEFCSVRELFCLLHRAASMPSYSAESIQSNGWKRKAATVPGNGQKLFQPSNSLLKKAWFVSGHHFSGAVTGPHFTAV